LGFFRGRFLFYWRDSSVSDTVQDTDQGRKKKPADSEEKLQFLGL